jgi:hypothetical protein
VPSWRFSERYRTLDRFEGVRELRGTLKQAAAIVVCFSPDT